MKLNISAVTNMPYEYLGCDKPAEKMSVKERQEFDRCWKEIIEPVLLALKEKSK